jgi:hypothetical protein
MPDDKIPDPIEELRRQATIAQERGYVDGERMVACWPWSHRWSRWHAGVLGLKQYRQCHHCGFVASRVI